MNKEIFISELREMLKHNYQDCARIERMIRVLELSISQEETESFIKEEMDKRSSAPNSQETKGLITCKETDSKSPDNIHTENERLMNNDYDKPALMSKEERSRRGGFMQ